ncbi:hypothetical protein B296_00022002 [Ensete ventricosum]|uniref:Uncharacterized protein n=1 Tax=Ensete ventricosum TaxID=4639 RepID=A0A427AEW5_ENSVE|nr:hypothetical protein B296_00022002 [Ensete ventricosum]
MAGACNGNAYERRQHPEGRHPRKRPLRGWRQPIREAIASIALVGAAPDEQRCPFVHKGSACHKGGRPWARRPPATRRTIACAATVTSTDG